MVELNSHDCYKFHKELNCFSYGLLNFVASSLIFA